MPTGFRRPPTGAGEALAAIERFLESAQDPALLEAGEDLFLLAPDKYAIDSGKGRLTLQVWDERRNITRRITGLVKESRGKLELAIEKFGRKQGQLLFIDLARPSGTDWARRGARFVFRERFRRMILRRFSGWKLAELSTEVDLEHTLSPVYPRAFVLKGQRAWAAIGSPPDADEGAVLSFGLIWLDYIRKRQGRLAVEGLAIFVPDTHVRTTAHRLRWLNSDAGRFELLAYSGDGCVSELDIRDAGNLHTRLEPCCRPVLGGSLVATVTSIPGVETVARNDGEISMRVRGLEFARSADGALTFGLGRRTPLSTETLAQARRLAEELLRLRHPGADRNSPLYRRAPECWLESQVRSSIEQVDATLLPEPVYGQVPAFIGGERGVIDLLAVDRSGKLVVIELKASADLHLPLQALDYWMRVNWHASLGDFESKGYFPGLPLRREAPKLLLISPALEFHPTTETLLSYLAPSIDVERIGLGVEWRKRLQVLFRIRRAASV